MNTFEDFKNQVAKTRGYEKWEPKIHENGIQYVENLLEIATTLFVESERKRTWIKACEAQRVKCADNMPAVFDSPSHFDKILTAPLAEYDPTN